MGVEKLNIHRDDGIVHLNKPADTSISSGANTKLSEYFSDIADADVAPSEKTLSIKEIIANINANKPKLNKPKPSMGLSSYDVTEAEENLKDTVSKSNKNLEVAETNVDDVTENSQEKTSLGQDAVDLATEAFNSAKKNLSKAEASVDSSQESLRDAQQALSLAQSDEERATAEEQIKIAEENLETSQEELKEIQDNVTETKRYMEKTEAELEEIKSCADTDIKIAEENVETVKAEGEDNIETAEEILEDVEKQTVEYEEEDYYLQLSGRDEYNEEIYNQAMKNLNKDNVVISDYYIVNNSDRSKEELNSDMDILSKALKEKAEEMGVDISDIHFEKYDESDYITVNEKKFLISEKADRNSDAHFTLYQRLKNAEYKDKSNENLRIFNDYQDEKLQSATQAYYEYKEGRTKIENCDNYDLGNGKIDKISTQEINNCWVEAPLNSLASSEAGKSLLEAHIYRDDELGITSVHLQEAEDKGLGHGGSGVYSFTDWEIKLGQKHLSSGDGDITAYNLAFEKYFRESGERSHLQGGEPARIFEIIGGAELAGLPQGYNGVHSEISYEDAYNMIKNGSGAITLDMNAEGISNPWIIGTRNHAISIVGVTDDGNLLVQESNNSGFNLDGYEKYEGETFNGAPTYIMTKKNYEQNVFRYASLYWGNT